MTEKSFLKRLLDWTSTTPNIEIQAEEEDIAFDRHKVDEKFMEALRAARHLRRASDAFIVAGELFVKDVNGGNHGTKVSSRRKKSQ